MNILGFVLTIVATAGTVVGAIIAYHQLRLQKLAVIADGKATRAPITSPQVSELREYLIFAPRARIQGFAKGFINREEELRSLESIVKSRKSILVLEGLPGVGKTSLAAALCERLQRHYHLRWIFCAERSLTLNSLVESLAFDLKLPVSKSLQAVASRGVSQPAELIDAVIEYLTTNHIILVFDDYHSVQDKNIQLLVEKLERSATQSTVLLTSRSHPEEVVKLPLAETHNIDGLSHQSARQFLRGRGIEAPDQVLDQVWEKAGHGNPEAMAILLGLAKHRSIHDTLGDLPVYTEDLKAWIGQLFNELKPTELKLAKLIAFVNEPARFELLREFTSHEELQEALEGLLSRFVVAKVGSRFEMHSLCRDYGQSLLTPDERKTFGLQVARYFQHKARNLLLGLGEEPSYGKLYLESFPDYINDKARHAQFIDDLLDRLKDNNLLPPPGSRILVLGSGNGTHDPGLAKYGFKITNVDIQQDIVDLGREQAKQLSAEIEYVVADMTKPLPFEPESMDAVFNIGSSFGYEEEDEDNAAIFRHATVVLKKGMPFVFEYANGIFWNRRNMERGIEQVTLPDGSIRTKYSAVDPVGRTSLQTISLQRQDGSVGWFHHFMHQYSPEEITQMMTNAGLEHVATYEAKDGAVKGNPFDPQKSTGMVIIAIKKAQS